MKTFLLKYYYAAILLGANKPSFWDKVEHLIKLLSALVPIGMILNAAGLWFDDNSMFFRGVIWAIVLNMFFGYKYHKQTVKDFKHSTFWAKNIKMWVILILVYPLLEILAILAGDNYVGETFKLVVQISTILYPGSKALKNCHLWSDRKYPPSFIMDKFYTFEKTGDLNELFNTKKDTNDA